MGSSSKDQTVTQTTDIPAFLQPYMQNQASMSNDALISLQKQLSGAGADQLVAPFNQNQRHGQQMAIDAAGNAVTNFNDPNGAAQTGMNVLKNAAQGGWLGKMLPSYEKGIDAAINAPNLAGIDPGMLSQFANQGYQLDPASLAALQGTASGNGLYGSAGFDEAVQASMRAARPSILSGYAQGGSGAIKGGLAQIGMQQAASDSFARLYGDERGRQMAAASQLGSFGLAGRGQQIDAAGQTFQGGIAQRGQDIDQQSLRNQAVMSLGGLLSAERSRQLQSAQNLPSLSLLGSQLEQQQANTLMDVGDQQQQLEQQQLTAPMTAQQMMIAALNGAPNFQSLMGQQSTQPVTRNRGAGAIGGAASGGQIGFQIGGPWGAAGGAAIGGLLGAFG